MVLLGKSIVTGGVNNDQIHKDRYRATHGAICMG